MLGKNEGARSIPDLILEKVKQSSPTGSLVVGSNYKQLALEISHEFHEGILFKNSPQRKTIFDAEMENNSERLRSILEVLLERLHNSQLPINNQQLTALWRHAQGDSWNVDNMEWKTIPELILEKVKERSPTGDSGLLLVGSDYKEVASEVSDEYMKFILNSQQQRLDALKSNFLSMHDHFDRMEVQMDELFHSTLDYYLTITDSFWDRYS